MRLRIPAHLAGRKRMIIMCPRAAYSHILSCYLGQRLVGHLIERNGECEARSWPDEVLIGVYATLIEAKVAILASVDTDEDEFKHVRRGPPDDVTLDQHFLELVEHHRFGETFALLRYLDDRGIQGDAAFKIISAVLKQYGEEIPERRQRVSKPFAVEKRRVRGVQ